MAKVSAPLLSFSASGTIAKTQTYATWRGVPYARQHVIPNNPKTAAQTMTRVAFAFVSNVFKLLPPAGVAPWDAFIKGKPLTSRNAMLSKNVSGLRTAADLAGMIFSPGYGGGAPATSITPVNAAGTVTTTFAVPELPTGWSIDSAVALLITDGDPQTSLKFQTWVGTDAVAPYAPTVAALPAGDYDVFGWLVYIKPDGSKAYGPSIASTVTV